MPWDPGQYHKFQSERSAPFFDLLSLVALRPDLKVVDLGCGTGELTRQLAGALPGADVTGLDNSAQMLEQARPFAGEGLRFVQGDQAQLEGTWDLIFSNAALQWSDDHRALIPRLVERLRPHGQLVVQVPSNHNHISHQVYRETAAVEPFRTVLQGFQRYAPVLSIDEYAELLFQAGMQEIVVFEKVYPHILEDADAVVEWISGTALVPYFERLGAHRKEFLEALRHTMRAALPGTPVFYPFRRTLFSARQAD